MSKPCEFEWQVDGYSYLTQRQAARYICETCNVVLFSCEIQNPEESDSMIKGPDKAKRDKAVEDHLLSRSPID